MKSIKAVYFDLDDTLCAYWSASKKGLFQAVSEANLQVTTEEFVEAWRNVFKSFAKEIKTDAWYERYLESGEPSRTEHIRRTLDALDIPSESNASKISKRYAELRDNHLVLFPDALPTLNALKSRYKLGLITNGPADVQRQEVKTLRIEEYFDQILIEGEFKTGKPHQVIFQAATSKWNFKPKDMLFVGNAFEHDVQGAKNAGWNAIWINRGKEERKEEGPQPDCVIEHLFEVFDWLEIPRPEQEQIQVPKDLVQNWR